jgi:hypothetical protein
MKKLIIILTLFLSLELSAQISPLKQYGHIDQGIAFVENVGQFRTYDGKPDKDVLYKAQVSGGEIYVRRNGISFVLTKTEQTSRKPKHDEDRMLSPEDKPEPGANLYYWGGFITIG